MPKEIYKAIVSRTNDPQNLGRVRVKCEGLAAANAEIPYWVSPIFPATADGTGWLLVPDPGDEVELEVMIDHVTDEVTGESFIANPDMRYRAGSYSSKNKLPSELKTNYPKRRGFKTKAGHLLFFDDTQGKEQVTLQASFGSAKPTVIKLTKDQITIENTDANMDVKVKTLNLIDGADQHLVRGDELKQWILKTLKVWAETHKHGTAVGPTSPSDTPLQAPPDTILSSVGKLK
jgi:hypothetical protein